MRKVKSSKPRGPTIVAPKNALRMAHPMKIVEVARLLRVRYHVVRRLVMSGKLPSKQIGGLYFIDRADADRCALTKPWSPWAMRKFKPSKYTNPR
jgi:excisionase family DNA binding protein